MTTWSRDSHNHRLFDTFKPGDFFNNVLSSEELLLFKNPNFTREPISRGNFICDLIVAES